jgi:hypothetical protein
MKAPDGWKESLDFILKKEIKNFWFLSKWTCSYPA